MLSISMVIQLVIFCYYMFKSFKGYNTFLKAQKSETKLSLNQKLIKYKEEKKEHFKITSQTQHSYFNLIWIFTFLFIILSYLCCIIIKSPKTHCLPDKQTLKFLSFRTNIYLYQVGLIFSYL